jgi:hypothetical protein
VNLSETGESRVNGYLFVLERSLRTFLPREVATDAVREIESHLRDRIAATAATPDERASLERILAELGPPLRVAQAYSAERIVDEAVATGRFVPMLRAMWYAAVNTAVGFPVALVLLVGYSMGIALFAVAVLKPIFPANVGMWANDGGWFPHNFGGQFPVPAGQHMVGGYWVIPIAVLCGLAAIVLTYRLQRWFLTWWRSRRRRGYGDAVVP